MSRSAHRREEQACHAARRRPTELHILEFDASGWNNPGRAATVLVRGKMGQVAAISLAYDQARAFGHGFAFCTRTRTVPAPRPTPALDALTRRLTAFPTFVALLTAAAGYRPSLRLDLLGRDGLLLARAYDRTQAAWGTPRRAFVTGCIPHGAIRPSCAAEA